MSVSEERLEEIRKWLTWAPQVASLAESHMQTRSLEYLRELLHEVDLQRYQRDDLLARVERAEAQRDKALGIVRDLAHRSHYYGAFEPLNLGECHFCYGHGRHTTSCLFTRARALEAAMKNEEQERSDATE